MELRTKPLPGALLVLGLFCLAPAPGVAQTAPNLLENGDFEAANGTAPAVWSVDPAVATKGKASTSNAFVVTGGSSLQLTPTSLNPTSARIAWPFGVGQAINAAGLRGTSLYVSASMQAEGTATAILRVYALSPDGTATVQELQQKMSGTGPVRRRDIVPIPANSTANVVLVFCMVQGTSGAAYFDDVSLSQGVPASWNEAVGRPDPGPGLSATVNVDAGQTIRQIPTTLFGSNLEWIWDGDGVWDPVQNALNTSVMDLTRTAGVTLLRFPGAAFADFYNWRNGVGPQATRPVTDARPGGPTSANRFGTDEALALAGQTNSKLLITVNVYSGTAAEAAAWVRYVNGSGRRVDYWEVGNENYVPGLGALTPEDYASRYLEFAQAMRAADPGIKVGAVSDENFSLAAPRHYPDWTERVVGIAGSQIDFLSVHCAYAPALYQDLGWDSRTVYSAMLAAPTLIGRQLNDLAGRLDALAPSRLQPIEIAVTEWGPYFQTDPSGRYVDHLKTLASALSVASTLKTFMESTHTNIANMFKLVDSTYLGWIGPRNGTYAAKAPLMAFQMYSNYFGPNLVASTTISPTYDSPAIGWVDAAGQVPFLDVITSRSSDSGTVYVMGINKHFDRDIQAHIHIQNFAVSGSATVRTLNGTAPDANTGTPLPSIPGVTWATQATIGPNSRFNNGGPGEVSISTTSLSNLTSDFDFVFKAHSITSIALTGR